MSDTTRSPQRATTVTPPADAAPDDLADYASTVLFGYDAGRQAGLTEGLTIGAQHAYAEGFAGGYAARQAELDQETADYLAAVDTISKLPARDRISDRARRDAAMIREGARQERALQRERDKETITRRARARLGMAS